MKEQREKKGKDRRGRGGVTFFQVLWSFLILYVNTASSQWRHESDEAVGGSGGSGVWGGSRQQCDLQHMTYINLGLFSSPKDEVTPSCVTPATVYLPAPDGAQCLHSAASLLLNSSVGNCASLCSLPLSLPSNVSSSEASSERVARLQTRGKHTCRLDQNKSWWGKTTITWLAGTKRRRVITHRVRERHQKEHERRQKKKGKKRKNMFGSSLACDSPAPYLTGINIYIYMYAASSSSTCE